MRGLLIFLILFTAITLTGCGEIAAVNKADAQPQERAGEGQGRWEENDAADLQVEISIESLGGVRLGMTALEAEKILGQGYVDEECVEAGYFEEDVAIRSYAGDCKLIIGKETGLIKQIEVYSEFYPTALGFKVGDLAEQVLDTYSGRYEEFVGRHSSDKLLGWFLISKNGELLIFSAQEDRERFNEMIAPDSKITGITLAYVYYFD